MHRIHFKNVTNVAEVFFSLSHHCHYVGGKYVALRNTATNHLLLKKKQVLFVISEIISKDQHNGYGMPIVCEIKTIETIGE